MKCVRVCVRVCVCVWEREREGKPELTATLYGLHLVNTTLVVFRSAGSLSHTEASSPVTPGRSPATDTVIMRKRRKGVFAFRPECWNRTMSHHVRSVLQPLESCCRGWRELSSSVGKNLTRGNTDWLFEVRAASAWCSSWENIHTGIHLKGPGARFTVYMRGYYITNPSARSEGDLKCRAETY